MTGPNTRTTGGDTPGLDQVAVDAAGVDELSIVPWPILLRRRLARRVGIDRRTASLVVVLAGLFTVAFTITLLVVSLDTIAGDLDSSVGLLTWSITGPMLAFGVVGPAYGKAGDLWGHRRVYLAGLAGAGLFAACTAVAWSGLSMVIFRTLSASAGAATGPSTMAYINRLYGPEERVKPLGYWSFVNAGAPVLGVVGGSFLVESVGWRLIFVIQAPLCLLGVVAAWWLLPDTERTHGVRFDAAGSITLGLAATTTLAAISQGHSWGWASPWTLGLLAVGATSAMGFVAVERRAAAPLLPLHWVRTRNVVFPIASQSLTNFAYMGGFLLAPQVLKQLFDLSAGRIGLVVIARPITFAVFAPLAGYMTVRVGERRAGVSGALLVMASMVGFAALRPGMGLGVAVVALMLSGAGLGVAAPALTSLVAGAVDPRDFGVAGALQQLGAQLGSVVGSVVMTVLRGGREGDGAFMLPFVVAALVAVLAAGSAAMVRPSVRRATR